ncbi:MAG: RNA polymerase sigma factor [Sphingomonadales bacterium]|nr:RNA polymerase sigma factor [Sphingomonadales bacterium]
MLNNNDIIAGCVNKDRIAQKALYEKYGAKMFGFCVRYTDSRADAQDLLQDGFIKVFDSIATLKDPSQLEGWMSRVFINLALSKFRKKSRGPLMVEVVDVSDEFTEEVTVESEPLEIEIVLQCLMSLPENYRMVLNLYAIDKLSHKEIAESLGTTISNSKSLLHRARVLLKELVEQQRNKDTGKQ